MKKKPPDLSFLPSPILPCLPPYPIRRPLQSITHSPLLTSLCAAIAYPRPRSLATVITPLRSILCPICGVPAVICHCSPHTVLNPVPTLVMAGLEAFLCSTQLGLWPISRFEALPLSSVLISARFDFTLRVSLAFLTDMFLSVTVSLDLDGSGMANASLSGWMCLFAAVQCLKPCYDDFLA